MRRVLTRTVLATLVALFSLAVAGPAGADGAPECTNENGCIRAVTVNGYLDHINVDFVRRAVEDLQGSEGYLAVVLVVDSPGSVVDDEELNELVDALVASQIPVSAWVGPNGAQALGGAAELVAALNPSMAPNTHIGEVGRPRLDPERYGDLVTSTDARLIDDVIDNEEAVEVGLSARTDLILGDHALNLEGVPSKEVTDDEGRPKRELLTDNVTVGLPITTQLLHTAASPAVAYMALAVAVGLLLFEFFTAGIGVAGVVGAAAAVMAAFGLGELPIRPWALGLCLFSAFAFGIDIQTAIPRFWTAVGLICWSVGSIFLFDGFRAPYLALAAGVIGIAVLMISGMPSMVRSRFGTPTLGRRWMIGLMGTAVTDVDPEGTVEVDGGIWRAITNRLTPLKAGDRLRVVAIDGMMLEVEPPEGGAIDYRELRRKRIEADGEADARSGDGGPAEADS